MMNDFLPVTSSSVSTVLPAREQVRSQPDTRDEAHGTGRHRPDETRREHDRHDDDRRTRRKTSAEEPEPFNGVLSQMLTAQQNTAGNGAHAASKVSGASEPSATHSAQANTAESVGRLNQTDSHQPKVVKVQSATTAEPTVAEPTAQSQQNSQPGARTQFPEQHGVPLRNQHLETQRATQQPQQPLPDTGRDPGQRNGQDGPQINGDRKADVQTAMLTAVKLQQQQQQNQFSLGVIENPAEAALQASRELPDPGRVQSSNAEALAVANAELASVTGGDVLFGEGLGEPTFGFDTGTEHSEFGTPASGILPALPLHESDIVEAIPGAVAEGFLPDAAAGQSQSIGETGSRPESDLPLSSPSESAPAGPSLGSPTAAVGNATIATGSFTAIESTLSTQPLSGQVSVAIYEHVRTLGPRDDSRLTLRLDPPELGELVISLRRSETGIAVRVTARESVTMDMLLARGQEIEGRLLDQQLNLTGIEFLRPDFAGSSSQGRAGDSDQRHAEWREQIGAVGGRRTSGASRQTSGASAAVTVRPQPGGLTFRA